MTKLNKWITISYIVLLAITVFPFTFPRVLFIMAVSTLAVSPIFEPERRSQLPGEFKAFLIFSYSTVPILIIFLLYDTQGDPTAEFFISFITNLYALKTEPAWSIALRFVIHSLLTLMLHAVNIQICRLEPQAEHSYPKEKPTSIAEVLTKKTEDDLNS